MSAKNSMTTRSMAKQKQSHHQKSHNLQAANKIRKQTVAQGQFNRAMAVFNSHGLLPRHKKEAALLLKVLLFLFRVLLLLTQTKKSINHLFGSKILCYFCLSFFLDL